jgi:hypothetical protein
MIEYTFLTGPFSFCIHAENDEEAISKGNRAINESCGPVTLDRVLRLDSAAGALKVDLTAGAFDGKLYYAKHLSLSTIDIIERKEISEEPF